MEKKASLFIKCLVALARLCCGSMLALEYPGAYFQTMDVPNLDERLRFQHKIANKRCSAKRALFPCGEQSPQKSDEFNSLLLSLESAWDSKLLLFQEINCPLDTEFTNAFDRSVANIFFKKIVKETNLTWKKKINKFVCYIMYLLLHCKFSNAKPIESMEVENNSFFLRTEKEVMAKSMENFLNSFNYGVLKDMTGGLLEYLSAIDGMLLRYISKTNQEFIEYLSFVKTFKGNLEILREDLKEAIETVDVYKLSNFETIRSFYESNIAKFNLVKDFYENIYSKFAAIESGHCGFKDHKLLSDFKNEIEPKILGVQDFVETFLDAISSKLVDDITFAELTYIFSCSLNNVCKIASKYLFNNNLSSFQTLDDKFNLESSMVKSLEQVILPIGERDVTLEIRSILDSLDLYCSLSCDFPFLQCFRAYINDIPAVKKTNIRWHY